MEIIKFLTAGSVDDGKSTLIGSLLYHTQSLKKDKIEAVSKISTVDNDSKIDYALFSDGLSLERAQGITIDVSYQYFSSKKRRYIIADCPGHEEFTRNMITGASHSDIIVLLVNAKNGLQKQTLMHLQIADMMGFKRVVVCVNKMDLVDYSEDKFVDICYQIKQKFGKTNMEFSFIPTAAIHGDNIVNRSNNMTWYVQDTLFDILEHVSVNTLENTALRFPVQLVQNIQNDHKETRHVLGSTYGGSIQVKDDVKIMPSGQITSVASLYLYNQQVNEVPNGSYCSIVLTNEIKIERGDIIVKAQEDLTTTSTVKAQLCWMDEQELNPTKTFILKFGSAEIFCQFIKTENSKEQQSVVLNTIFTAHISTTSPIFIDKYSDNRSLGAVIVICPETNNTVAGGVVI